MTENEVLENSVKNSVINYKSDKTTLSKIGMSYFFLLLIMFIIPTVLIGIFHTNDNNFALLFNFIGFVVGFIFLRYYIKKIPKSDNIENNSLSIYKYVYYLIMGYGLMIFGYFISNILKGFFVPTGVDPLQTLQSSNIIGTFFYAVIFGPIFEEYFFRKFLIDRTIRYGELFAVLTSAFMFMIYHMNIYQFLGVFLFGIILAHVYIKTNNILYTITMHQIGNFLGLIVPTVIGSSKVLIDGYNIFEFVLMCLSIGFFIYYLYYVKFKNNTGLSNRELFKMFFTNTGTILFILFGLVIALLNLNMPWIVSLLH
ncbi:hypothetical protein BGI41_07225 [Methanobrevibacter sp. 87.7]|uniref:CPBP family intramembrane glutamic endopeptidase n=1 Tax=Methanobrevibacter sp. 87.7 TaxID=387957 RepID=UPI000B6D5C90|nr:type II CAAX endopeptidase family protein [Methanobrevibacter sp. 87.7]OWT32524.1 hypothetical protein BGI41_07225 [Methanobrevibacter sp. 87.7]